MNIYVLFLLYLQYNYNSHFLMPIATESPSFTISQLNMAAQAYFNMGISTATRKAYTAGLCKYNTFCREINQPPYQSVKIHCCCLSQIWPIKIYPMQQYKCISLWYDTVTSQLVSLLPPRTPRLNCVLKGIWKTCAMNHQPRE